MVQEDSGMSKFWAAMVIAFAGGAGFAAGGLLIKQLSKPSTAPAAQGLWRAEMAQRVSLGHVGLRGHVQWRMIN